MAKVVVIGDALVNSATLEDAAHQLNIDGPIEVKKFEWYSELEKFDFQEKILQIETYGPEAVDIPEGICEELETADYLLLHYAPVSRKMIESAKQLRLIGTCRGGMEHVNLEACNEKGIPVIHVIRNAEPVADFTLGLILSETRNIARSHHYIMEGKWVKTFANDPFKTTLSNLKVGLLGFGYIGKLVFKRLTALGVDVLVYDPYINEEEHNVNLVDLETLFKESDVVSLHAKLTSETANIVNEDLIRLMKPSGYLINSARAGLVNRDDIVSALRERRIAGAALDVSWTEPIDVDDELLKLDNITLTSHIAGDTVDAIPKSPYLLKNVLNDYFEYGRSPMLVNSK